VSSFRVVGSTPVIQSGFISMSEVRVAGDDEAFTRTVVHHPGAVVVVAVERGGLHARLVRQFRASVGTELLEVVAGKRDVDGEAPEETARRELEEELGVRTHRLVPLAEFYNSPGFCDEYTYLYAALELEELDDPRHVSPEEAAMTVERIAFADVERLVATRELVDAKSIIGLLLARGLVADEAAGA